MPPPPPPSASYNLVFDDTSSEEEDEEDYRKYRGRDGIIDAACTRAAVATSAEEMPTVTAEAYLAPTVDGDDGEEDEEEEESDDEHDAAWRRADEEGNLPWAREVPDALASIVTVDGYTGTAPNSTAASTSRATQDGTDHPGISSAYEEIINSCVAASVDASVASSADMMKSSIENCSKRIRTASLESPTKLPPSGVGDNEGEEDDDDVAAAGAAEAQGGDVEDGATKKKKKKKKKRKKKKNKSTTEGEAEDSAMGDGGAVDSTFGPSRDLSPKRPKKSVGFGTVSVREYKRCLGTTVVPANGEWPLGLSDEVVAEHNPPSAKGASDGAGASAVPSNSPEEDHDPLSSVSSSSPPSSPSTNRRHGHGHGHHRHGHHGWTVDDFEYRRQHDLRERYVSLVRKVRRSNFEKECEKRHKHEHRHDHHHHHGHHHGHNTRGKSRTMSGSMSGSRSMSGSHSHSKTELTAEEKTELEALLKEPINIPEGTLESRPYDYRKKDIISAKKDGAVSEVEDELAALYKGRNPLFASLKESERKQVLVRDAEPHTHDSAGGGGARKRASSDADHHRNPYDSTELQHVRHDLEAIRIRRSEDTNFGCSCRKLHVFLPGGGNSGGGKKKGSHRRMTERKVREELRRRKLKGGGSREELERRLHDAVEQEPCCWGNDCPCAKSGIGCQADTCSCWHASHNDTGASSSSSQKKSSAGDDGGSRRVVKEKVDMIQQQCGNRNGMYVVNFEKIRMHREQYVNAHVASEI